MLFGGNPRYENVPLIGRGSPPPSVGWPSRGLREHNPQYITTGHSSETLLSYYRDTLLFSSFPQAFNRVQTFTIFLLCCLATNGRLPSGGHKVTYIHSMTIGDHDTMYCIQSSTLLSNHTLYRCM